MKKLASILSCTLLVLELGAQSVTEASAENSALKAAHAKAVAAWDAKNWDAAIPAYREVVKLSPKDGEAWHHLGYALHMTQQLDEALIAHLEATKDARYGAIGWYNAACVHALKGRKEQAVEALEQSIAGGFGDRQQLLGDTDFESLHDDARFQKLVESLPDAPSARAARPYAYNGKRSGARLAYFSAGGSPGQVAVDFGQPTWKAEYAKQVKSESSIGRRWRCGLDFWTTFDTNIDLSIAGTEIPAGNYYLTLERTDANNIVLWFNDPAPIRKRKLDAYVAHLVTGGIAVPMSLSEGEETTEALDFRFVTGKDNGKATLELRFGPYLLSAPMKLHFDR